MIPRLHVIENNHPHNTPFAHIRLVLNNKVSVYYVFVIYYLGLFLLTAVIIFGAKLDHEPLETACEPDAIYFKISWSYVCCAIAAILHSLSGFSALVQVVNIRTKHVKAQQHATPQRMDQSFTPYTSFPELPDPNNPNNPDSNASTT